ncbi:hypothetical protein [Arthrobacter sp.]|uniref:hypothetical protein n=1 Tax=Arthrobacter sp. TaxID=1667 RepID=UPI0028113FFA|nr:hypothetical protein [Arthrobacter sp.]
MAERGNTTHGPQVDDQMKHETQGLVHSNHPTRAEDWRETESVDDSDDTAEGDQPVYVSQTNQGEGAVVEDGLTQSVDEAAGNDDDEEAQ